MFFGTRGMGNSSSTRASSARFATIRATPRWGVSFAPKWGSRSCVSCLRSRTTSRRTPSRFVAYSLPTRIWTTLVECPTYRKNVPFYTGKGELDERGFLNFFVQGSTDRSFDGLGPSGEWRFRPDADGYFDGVVDVFGDRSLFAIWVPGHSAGSTAYLARTATGPVLMVGDACHTRFGWENGVEPGDFSSDRARSVGSLARLRKLVVAYPNIDVRLGHQVLSTSGKTTAKEPSAVSSAR